MPYHFNYQIGDKIWHKKFGIGIVLGTKPAPKGTHTMAFYHVYYYDANVFGYSIHATMTKTNDATDETRDEARQILLTKLLEPISDNMPRTYHMGDIVVFNNKAHLILDNGRPVGDKLKYHIYQPNTDVFLYSILNDGYTARPATKFTIQKAKHIIRAYFLLPAFS